MFSLELKLKRRTETAKGREGYFKMPKDNERTDKDQLLDVANHSLDELMRIDKLVCKVLNISTKDTDSTYESVARLVRAYSEAGGPPMPTIECPECGDVQEDLDGFGFIFCPACCHCTHPNTYEGRCGICGEEVEL